MNFIFFGFKLHKCNHVTTDDLDTTGGHGSALSEEAREKALDREYHQCINNLQYYEVSYTVLFLRIYPGNVLASVLYAVRSTLGKQYSKSCYLIYH